MFEELLKKYNTELVKNVNVNSLLPHLKHEGLLTSEEFDKLISTNKTNREKKQFLFSILPSKGDNAYERFLCCLSEDMGHRGHTDLVKLLTAVRPSTVVSYV